MGFFGFERWTGGSDVVHFFILSSLFMSTNLTLTKTNRLKTTSTKFVRRLSSSSSTFCSVLTRCSFCRRSSGMSGRNIPGNGCSWNTWVPLRRRRTSGPCPRTSRPGPWSRTCGHRCPSPSRSGTLSRPPQRGGCGSYRRSADRRTRTQYWCRRWRSGPLWRAWWRR